MGWALTPYDSCPTVGVKVDSRTFESQLEGGYYDNYSAAVASKSPSCMCFVKDVYYSSAIRYILWQHIQCRARFCAIARHYESLGLFYCLQHVAAHQAGRPHF
eukprot:1185136-Prorocentrum_minimum.AAC.4